MGSTLQLLTGEPESGAGPYNVETDMLYHVFNFAEKQGKMLSVKDDRECIKD